MLIARTALVSLVALGLVGCGEGSGDQSATSGDPTDATHAESNYAGNGLNSWHE